MPVELFQREWGTGQPVIAMHPLGLDSSAFEGVGQALAPHGFRTIAVDLPGFGRTPAPPEPLTPAVMAAPVIALARTLDPPPLVLGISMGGRVALEIALSAPQAIRGVIPIAPYLPWRRFRVFLEAARFIDPGLAAWLPLERVWPALRWLGRAFETLPYLRDDHVAQAGARLVYYLACPATRASFLSAARELALDPATGLDGFWTRLLGLSVPAAFVWGERDQLVALEFSRPVARTAPRVPQLLLPCLGHWLNGPHHQCLAEAVAELAVHILRGTPLVAERHRRRGVAFVVRGCVVGGEVRAAGAVSVAGG